jgi:hypothetical protein
MLLYSNDETRNRFRSNSLAIDNVETICRLVLP